jgi:pre-rRNA-processing protein IPI3
MVWNYHSGQALRTYLLPEVPKAVALDPADRAFYVAYEDGSLQTLSFYDEVQQSTAVDITRDGSQSHRPVQPSPSTRFNAESQKLGGALSLDLSWDGTTLISGHESGKVASWDIAKGNYMATLASLPGPVTNLRFLPPTGFPVSEEPRFKIHTIVKPRQDVGTSSGSSLVPPNYSWTVQLTGRINDGPLSATEERKPKISDFEAALTHPSFPLEMLEESLAELHSWDPRAGKGSARIAPAADFVSLSAMEPETAAEKNGNGSSSSNVIQGDEDSNKAQEDEIRELKKQVASLQRIQKVTFAQLAELREEKDWFVEREKQRALQRQKQRAGGKEGPRLENGNADGDVEMSEGASSSEAASSSSAEEASDSDDVDVSDDEEEEEEG